MLTKCHQPNNNPIHPPLLSINQMSPNYEDSEDNTLRTIFDDFEGILTNILREERGAVRHTGQQAHLQWLCSVTR